MSPPVLRYLPRRDGRREVVLTRDGVEERFFLSSADLVVFLADIATAASTLLVFPEQRGPSKI